MKITREARNAVGSLWSSLGGDPSLDEGEEPIDCCDPGGSPPVDRALDQPVFTVNTPAVGGIVQTKASAFVPTPSGDYSVSFDTPPTNGNTLYALLFSTSGIVVDSAGWTLSETATANGDQIRLYRKVAGASEPSAVHVDVLGIVGTSRLVLYEVAGTFDVDGHTTDDTITSPLTGPSITPSDDPSLLIAAFAGQVATYAGNPTWTPLGGLVLDSFARQSPGRMVSGAYHKELADTSAVVPSISTTALYAGTKTSTIAFTTLTADPTAVVWNVPAPNTVDADDVTYHEIDGPDVLRVDLGGAFRIVRSRLLAGSDDAGSRTYTIRGANEADFSDAVALATVSVDTTGSFTGDEIDLLWSTSATYRYFELTGSDETRRVYSWELYEPDTSEGEDHDHSDIESDIHDVAAAIDEHIVDDEDAHDASAISIEDVDDYYTGTTVEEALAEIGAGGIGGSSSAPAFIGCSLTKSAVQAITTGGSGTVLTFDGEDFDTDGLHSTSSNTGRITIPAGMGGKWMIGGSVALDSISDAKEIIGRIKRNGTTDIRIFGRQRVGGTTSPVSSGAFPYQLDAGDYIELTVQHDHGSDRDARQTSGGTTFWAYKADSGKAGTAIGARVYNSTTQTVTAGVETALTFNSEEYDTDGIHSTSSNTSRMTVPAGLGGKWFVRAHVFAPSSHGVLFARLKKNGTTFVTGSEDDLVSGTDSSLFPGAVIDLAAGDYVEVFASRASGTAFGATTGSSSCAFEMFRIDSGSGEPYTIPTITNACGAFTSSSASCAATFGSAPVTGDKLIAVVASTGRGANSITQTNVTWTKIYGSSGNSQFFEVWAGVVTGAAGTGITANFTGNNTQQLSAWVWNELPAAATLGTALSTSTSAGRTIHTNEATTALGQRLIIGRTAAAPASSYFICNQECYAPSVSTFGGQVQLLLVRARATRTTYVTIQSSSVADFGAIVAIT